MDTKKLRSMLFNEKKNGWDIISQEEKAAVMSFAEGYKLFLDSSKTEREAVREAVNLARDAGFKPYKKGDAVKPGDKIYSENRGKALFCAVVGSESLSEGFNLVAAHIDSPRLDLKPQPLYEEKPELAYLSTHYYGGIKKYQWLTLPLALHGTVMLASGQTVDITIGERDGEPRFVITDVAPHIGGKMMSQTVTDAFKGEGLRILISGIPSESDTEGGDRVKLAVLEHLYGRYGMTERDFLSAELVAVPAFKACDIGFDRSFIGAYGHDDRVCAYPALMSVLSLSSVPVRTAVCMLADKEEVGSGSVTGICSEYFERFFGMLCEAQGVSLAECFARSACMSADVTTAFDPLYRDVYDFNNASYCNYGASIMKYTGARGKSGASDASAEFMGTVRGLLDRAGVIWQTGELGKVDEGGGGTVANFVALRNIDTVDLGVPVMSMHSPFETISKLDLYMTKRASEVFIKEMR